MPGTEDYTHLGTKFFEEVGRALQPYLELFVLLAAGEDSLDRLVAAYVPSVTTGHRVTGMPREGHYATPLDMLPSPFEHQSERNSVQVLLVAEFDAAQFKTEHHGVLAGDRLDVGTLQRVALVIFYAPGVAVCEVILMAIGYQPAFCKRVQAPGQLLLGGLRGLLVACTACCQKHCGHYNRSSHGSVKTWGRCYIQRPGYNPAPRCSMLWR